MTSLIPTIITQTWGLLRVFAVALCVLSVVHPGHARARKNGSTPQINVRNNSAATFIRQAYAIQANGIETMNANKALGFTTPDFQSTNKMGVLKSKNQCILGIFQLFENATLLHASLVYKVSVQQINVTADTANVIVTEHLIYTIPASSRRSRVPLRSEVYETYYDTWVKTNRGWMQKESVWIGDGKQLS